LEQEAFFSPQTECLLQRQTHADVRIGDTLEPAVYLLCLVVISDKPAVWDTECWIVGRNRPCVAHLLRPPAAERPFGF
jgi:hypothetical protein